MYKKLILIIIIAVLTFHNKNNDNNQSLLPLTWLAAMQIFRKCLLRD